MSFVHVFNMLRILTLVSQIADLEALVSDLGRRNDGCVTDQRVVDTRVRDKVGLELVQVDVERTVESQTGRN